MMANINIRIKYLFSKRIGGAWGNEPVEGNSIVCIRAADFDTDSMSHSKNDLTKRSFEAAELEKKHLLYGDLIIEKSGGGDNQPVGRVVRFDLNEIALCSNFLECLRPNQDLAIPSYLLYLLYSLWNRRIVTASIKQTTGIQNLDITDYFDNKIDLPGLEEQERLVQYLDKEISFIDHLINQKKFQLQFLAEKRQALITQAVTRGLNPNVQLKDSGIEWVSKIPVHWEVKKLKYISDLKSGDFITSESIREEGLFPVYGGNGLRGFTSDKTHEGDFVLIGRQGALCGNINYAFGHFWASEHAIVCNPLVEYNVTWLGELLRVMNLNQYSIAAAQPGLSVDVIKNLPVPVPSVIEQNDISNFIHRETQLIDKIESATVNSIELLKERRSSLITAAVTGQLEMQS